MQLNKSERHQLIKKISKASGIAQYALDKKMTNEQIVELQQNLDVLEILKDANNYNRYTQGQKTRAANEKLKQFINPDHSEIISAGKWLINALQKKGGERQQVLLEKKLVHKTDYNGAIGEMQDSLEDMYQTGHKMNINAEVKIRELEKRIDTLKNQLSSTQSFIVNNYGQKTWREIKDRFSI